MHACKLSDLFRSQLCMWLVQLNVLCSFTLIFLLHVLHSVKFSLSIHHISHQLLCRVIITSKRFPLVSAQFVLFVPQPFCLYVHPLGSWSFLIFLLLLLLPSRCKEGKTSGEMGAQRVSARRLLTRHIGRMQAGKNAAFMIFTKITVLMKYG